MLFFERVHKFLNYLDDKIGEGFLGQMPNDLRSYIYTNWLKLAGAKIGKGSRVHFKVKVWIPKNITIGDGVKVPSSTDMAGMGKITIGDFTLIGANVSFITNHHPIEDENLSWYEVLGGTQKDITIGKYCWLMNNTTIVAGHSGLKVGDYSWVTTGAVVTKDISDCESWGGIPAKFIRKIVPRQQE